MALVLDEKEKLIGILSDGDVRRQIIRNVDLQISVFEVMNKNFKSINVKDNYEIGLKIMKKEKITKLPVIDDDGKVKDILNLDDLCLNSDLENSIVIMAGGKGKRLRPHTSNCPKPMLEIQGKPILEIILENYISLGFKKFYFSVNYLKEMIIDYFKDGSKWGVSINYLIESKPLGTAGSLKLLPHNLTNPFLVINGDVLSKIDPRKLIQFHNENNAISTLCVRPHEINIPFGVVQNNGIEFIDIVEKPSISEFVNTGIYLLNPEILELIPHGFYIDMPDLFKITKSKGKKTLVFPIHEYWIDIGRKEMLDQAEITWET